jgi:hypothetical protein
MPKQNQDESEYQPRWYELITLQEAAKLSGLSLDQLRILADNEEIWAKDLGSDRFTTELSIKEYLAHSHQPGSKNR